MRIHIAHDRKGKPVVEIDGHEGDSVKDIVTTYKEINRQLLSKDEGEPATPDKGK